MFPLITDMKIYTKQRNGNCRIFSIFGLKFTYTKRQKHFPKSVRFHSFDFKLVKARILRKYWPVFESISDGDICIDCGCNAGAVSDVFLHKGALTYAFEPHPDLFQELSKKYDAEPKIRLFHVAVWDRNTRKTLHVQKTEGISTFNLEGTTIFCNRIDAEVESICDVEVIDLIEFVNRLDARVNILKIDVEGAEFEIIDKLLDSGAYAKIDHVFCETYPHFFPDGSERLENLERRIQQMGVENIHLDWV